jgi:hypothetical protein
MTRDEERRVDDLPEERGTMSAREALARSLAYADDLSPSEGLARIGLYRAQADRTMESLAFLGFSIGPSIPSPR